MAPKKKGGQKKAKDDNWEDEIGESPDPIAQATESAKAEEAANDVEEDGGLGGGGLLAALKKNRGKKQKKGKVVEDFVEGEDPTADGEDGTSTPTIDLSAKAPQEANLDDDEDVFGQPNKKGKAGKGGKQQPEQPKDDEDEEDEGDGSGRILTKKEKERAKKEREKQRKKEQVGLDVIHPSLNIHAKITCSGYQEEDRGSCPNEGTGEGGRGGKG